MESHYERTGMKKHIEKRLIIEELLFKKTNENYYIERYDSGVKCREYVCEGYGKYLSEFHENGNIRERKYIFYGSERDYHSFYDNEGIINCEAIWSQSKSVSVSYYNNKKIASITEYFGCNTGLKNGLKTRYYANGNLHYEYNYKKDKLCGLCIYYYKSGGVKKKKYIDFNGVEYYRNRYRVYSYKNKCIFFY